MPPLLHAARRAAPLSLVLLAALAAGCRSYPQRTAKALRDFQGGHLVRSLEAFADPDLVESPFLRGAEAGTVALTLGDWERALELLHEAEAASDEALGRGALETSQLLENLASFGLNDTTKAYGGEGFERVYLHACLAMAYLALGRLDDVGVEARVANGILEREEELYETSYRAGGIGHLMSALTYELRGELDQAYIDYERMVEKEVGTELAGKALVRIATQLGRPERERWEERFGADTPRPEGAASIVVLAGVGLGPFKVETSFPVPTKDGFVPFAVPSYRVRPQPVEALSLSLAEGGESVRTARVESVSQVAEKNLSDRIVWLTTKSVGRGFLKRELTKHLEDEYGIGGRIAGDLFAVISERADLRAWSTLPDSWQAARLFVPPGEHGLLLEAVGGEVLDLGRYELEPGETMIVLARSVGTSLFAHPIGGRPVGLPPAAVSEGEAAMAP